MKRKIDPSGRISHIYKDFPVQLAIKKKRFAISAATSKRKSTKDDEHLFELIDSNLVQPCYNVTSPSISLSITKDYDEYKLYLSDADLFTTMLFSDIENGRLDIYRQLLRDSLPADLGYLYEK